MMKFKKKLFVCALAFSACLVCTNLQANAVEVPVSNTNAAVTPAATLDGVVTKTQTKVDYTLMTTAQQQELVTKIGNKILAANAVDTKVNFVLIDQNVANAYTDVADTVGVFTGLLKYCENEDELAFIIGHEIGHAASNHVIKGIVTEVVADTGTTVAKNVAGNALKKSGFAGKFASYTGIDVTSVAATGIDYTKAAGTSKMQRGREDKADELGLDFVVKAGYNPLAGISIMYKIGANYSDFWADHPSTDKRVISMYEYVQEKYPQFIQQGFASSAYQEAVSKYINNAQ